MMPLDFSQEREESTASWQQSDPTGALIERVSWDTWFVELPDSGATDDETPFDDADEHHVIPARTSRFYLFVRERKPLHRGFSPPFQLEVFIPRNTARKRFDGISCWIPEPVSCDYTDLTNVCHSNLKNKEQLLQSYSSIRTLPHRSGGD